MSRIAQHKHPLMQSIQTAFTKLDAEYQTIAPEHTRLLLVDGNRADMHISVCDTLAYLIGWGHLLLDWHQAKQAGQEPVLPAPGFGWNELGRLAEHFYARYAAWSYADLLAEWRQTMRTVLDWVAALDDEALYGHVWYRQYPLGRMIQLNTSAPMNNMRTKIRRCKREHGWCQ